jgi:hypothetical protein
MLLVFGYVRIDTCFEKLKKCFVPFTDQAIIIGLVFDGAYCGHLVSFGFFIQESFRVFMELCILQSL